MSALTLGGRFTIRERPPITHWVEETHGLGTEDLTRFWALRGLHQCFLSQQKDLERAFRENVDQNLAIIPDNIRQQIAVVTALLEIVHESQALWPTQGIADAISRNTDYLRSLHECYKSACPGLTMPILPLPERPPISRWVKDPPGLGEEDLTRFWALTGLHSWYFDERRELERVYKENNGRHQAIIPEIVRQLIIRVTQLIEIEREIQALDPSQAVKQALLENTKCLRTLREAQNLWPVPSASNVSASSISCREQRSGMHVVKRLLTPGSSGVPVATCMYFSAFMIAGPFLLWGASAGYVAAILVLFAVVYVVRCA